MGDAILAFFGAPIGHEDDPQRAVMAGLDIINEIAPYREEVKRRWGLEFNVRVGINTGLVVVGEVGSDLRVEYTALGDAVNLASRMEQTAAPGTVQITEDTHRQIAPLFDFEDIGGIDVKGKSEPVHAFRVLRAKALPGQVRGIEGLDSPLIGRDGEMAELREVITDLSQGNGQILSLMGDPGLGKSRLLAELKKNLVAEGVVSTTGVTSINTNGSQSASIAWCEGRSLSYQTTTPFAPLIDLFNECFGLDDEADDSKKYELISEQVALHARGQVVEIAPFLATMLEIDIPTDAAERVRYLEPPQVRAGIFRAVQEFIEGLATEKPLVLVFEDLHWVDPTSLELIEQLMPLTDRVSLMLVGNFRPWRQEPSWAFHEKGSRDYSHRYRSVTLQPLSADDSRELVARLLEVEDLPLRVRNLILEKAEGNPFFVEEVIRSLLDSGLVIRQDNHWRATKEIESIAVPNTLTGVITARLDRLDDTSKRVAQTASVLGREFQFDTLVTVHGGGQSLEDALMDLQRRELVREKSRLPHRIYTFKHAVTQETVYSSLLLSARRELHLRAAGALEDADSDRVTEIAHHCIEAREEARALPYLVEAGDRAAHAYATPEAIGFYKQAIEIVQRVEDIDLARRGYEGLGCALSLTNEVQGTVDNYQDMIRFGESHGNVPMVVSAHNKLGLILGLRLGQFEDAISNLNEAERLAREVNDIPGIAEMHMIQCNFCTATADFEGAVTHLSEAARIGRELNAEIPKLYGLTHIANTRTYMALFDDAWETAQETRRLAEAAGNRLFQSELLTFSIPMYELRNGNLDAARRSAQEGLDMATQIGSASSEASGAYFLGRIAELHGDYESAIEHFQRALRAAQTTGVGPWTESMVLCALGTQYISINMDLVETTNEYHGAAIEVIKRPGGTVTGGTAWAELGFCVMAKGDFDQAGEFFNLGLNTPTATMHLERPRLLIGCTMLSLMQGDADAAAPFVKEAREFVEERQMKHYYPFVEFADGMVNMMQGNWETSLARFMRSEELAMLMPVRPIIWQARAGAAQALSVLGRDSEADRMRAKTHAMIDEIAGFFKNAEYRDLFVEGAHGKLTAMFGWKEEVPVA